MAYSIALLRGINVSGKNKIRMADLKALFEGLGCESVTTYLQSGNVVYHAPKTVSAKSIEQAIQNQLGLDVPVLTLTADTLTHISQNNPFLNSDEAEPAQCYVTFLWDSPSQTSLAELTLPQNETGRCSISDNCIYVHCPNGYGRTKIHNVFFEKKLRLLATTRNWKTVNALLEISAESEEHRA